MNSHKQRARRKTVTWQAASLALLAGAIGLGAVPLALGPGKYTAAKAPAATESAPVVTSLGTGQFTLVLKAMNTLVPKVDEPPPPPPTDVAAAEEKAPPPPPPVPTGEWQYTGYMKGPTLTRAVVSYGEPRTQVIVGEGEERNNLKLVSIQPDHIIVEPSGGGEQKRINLAQRDSQASWMTTSPRRAPAAAARAPGMNPGLNPAMAGQPGSMGQPMPGFGTPSAAAMAEAQRRMKAAIAPGPQMGEDAEMDRLLKLQNSLEEAGGLNQDQLDLLNKAFSDPSLGSDETGKILREIGIPVDASPEERGEFLERIGVSEKTHGKLYHQLREGSGGGGGK